MPSPKLILGQWLVICDRCGFRFHNPGLSQEWTGLRVCKDCIESRHPADLARIPRTEGTPPWVRPEPADLYTNVPYIPLPEEGPTAFGRYAQADYGEADFAITDNINGGLL